MAGRSERTPGLGVTLSISAGGHRDALPALRKLGPGTGSTFGRGHRRGPTGWYRGVIVHCRVDKRGPSCMPGPPLNGATVFVLPACGSARGLYSQIVEAATVLLADKAEWAGKKRRR